MADDLYNKAVFAVTNDRKASTSFIQRRLQISYNSAAELMERMEKNGVVTAADHVGKRDILVGPTDPSSFSSPQRGEGDREAVEGYLPSTPAPPAPAEPKGPPKTYECARCDATEYCSGLPAGWETRESISLGTYLVCQPCGGTDRAKIENAALCRTIASGDAASISSNDVITGAAQTRLRTIIERVERLEEDKAVIANDIKEVYAEAKGEGFDVQILKRVVTFRKKDKVKREEEDAIFDLYISSIGM
ncbi:hypothetical protein ABAC460_10070 [Asticcacaulis sp. AC460]|nr:hypothetical protein ABAC460_10070 [Asticcacaulis sp. AC460]